MPRTQYSAAGQFGGVTMKARLDRTLMYKMRARPNLEHMDLEATDASTQQNPEQMDEEFTTTAYPNVQENLKLPSKDSVIPEEPGSSTGTLKAVDEIVTDAVDWAMQAPLRARFSDLPAIDMKEILQQRIPTPIRLEEACQKKRNRRDVPRTLSSSPPPQPPPPPPLAGASGAPGSEAPSLSKSTASAPQSMAWTTSDTRYESAGFFGTQELSLTDSLIQDDSILDEQEIPVTHEPAWTNPSSTVSDVENNWATVLVLAYETPVENSLLAKTGDMTNFLNWYCRQMEECHKMLTDQVDWTNPEGDQVRVDVNQPLPLDGSPGHVTIQTQLFFNKDLEYLRYGSKGSSPALPISKMKAASYPDFGLELLMPEQMLIDDVCTITTCKFQQM
nr:hypothetical protein [Tanacetum cinerariifolium]